MSQESRDFVSDDKHENIYNDLNNTINTSLGDEEQDNNVMDRFAKFVQHISTMNANDMELYQMSSDDFELDKILTYLVQFNKQNNYNTNEINVVYKNLTVVGKNTAASVLKDVSDVFFKPLSILYQKRQQRKNQNSFNLHDLPKQRKIIRNVSGFASPGTMTLVLGRPGAGCSTYLKALAGETKTYKGVEGLLSYNGIERQEMMKNLSNLLIYNPELDIHFPFLTVEQTLKFVISCKTPTIRYDNKTRDEFIENMKDLYEILFGLKFVEKTLVGNDFVRGISGGQRKRVSIAEAMAASGSVYCFDNATRGLDASTALEFVEALRTTTNIYKTSSIVTIYQASENIYDLFDYVTVLYLGRQIYFGPVTRAVQYFERLGFVKHPRETTSEFLTSMTDPLARTVNANLVNKIDIPSTADEFEAAWQNSSEYMELQQQIDDKLQSFTDPASEFNQLKFNHQLAKQNYTSKNSQFTVNYWTQLKACCKRRVNIVSNNRAYPITLIVAALIQSLVIGSLSYNIPVATVGAFSRGGVIFFSCLYFAIMTLAETPAFFIDKNILNKQYSYNLYHPSAELLSKQLMQFPIKLVAITVFCVILYFMTNMVKEPGPFFQYYLFINLLVQIISALFTMFACIMPNASAAMGISGITMMSMVIYSSYMIQRSSMHWWFKWFSYVNPLFYAFESIIMMQFHNLRMPCSPVQLIPNGPGYENINTVFNQVCGFVGAVPSKVIYDGVNDVDGSMYLKLAFGYSFSHVWRNLGILFGFLVGYTLISCVAVEIFNPIVASSDQLVFIKTAKITKNMYQHINTITAESVLSDDSTIDLESNRDEEQSLSVGSLTIDENGNSNRLGSNNVFTWKNVNYVVPYEGDERKLLEDVQGYVCPGTLTALMGESGAGKTTLLNVLSRRTDVGVVTGDMLINGKIMGSSFERRTGYVQQQDLHIAELTVKESLIFSARLRRPRSVPDAEKIEYVEMIMNLLHMEDYADSIAGRVGYGLNVEQRKKLSIATELVAKPSLLLFLDEPTSGLDSQSSWAIIQVLKELAKAGQAILCTIHQPSATLFEQFDRLLLLKKGGQTVYFGDIGEDSKTIIDYFERNGGRMCDGKENPAEYILEVIGAGATATATQDWYETWINSVEFGRVSDEINELIEKNINVVDEDFDNKELETKYATGYMYQFQIVLNRTFMEFYRSLPYIMPKFMLTLLGGLVVGFSFWNTNHSIIGMQNVMFANLLTIIISSPLMNQIQGKAIASRDLFEVRESKSNTFHWSCLLVSQYLNEIPYAICFSTVYFICWYFPIQLDTAPRVAGFWWFTYCFFYQLWYPSFALSVLYAAPDLPSANILLGLMFNFCISFCGVFQRPQLMPGFWKFMWRASPLTYFLGNELSVMLHDRPVECSDTEYNFLEPPSGQTCGAYLSNYFENNNGYVANPDDSSNCKVCNYSVGDNFINSIGINYDDRWRNVGLFCVYIVFNLFLMNFMYFIFRVQRYSPRKAIKKLFGKK